jgi:hypothetical protein
VLCLIFLHALDYDEVDLTVFEWRFGERRQSHKDHRSRDFHLHRDLTPNPAARTPRRRGQLAEHSLKLAPVGPRNWR